MSDARPPVQRRWPWTIGAVVFGLVASGATSLAVMFAYFGVRLIWFPYPSEIRSTDREGVFLLCITAFLALIAFAFWSVTRACVRAVRTSPADVSP